MVQRKVPNKPGIQADHVKSEKKRLGNIKQTSCQHHQDGKNRGPELKKKMKRSRSIKLADVEGLKSSPLRKPISQPGKPPPFNPPATAATPRKLPNYMKATSSSESRKEQSLVRDAKLGSASPNKPVKTLAKTSSFKLARSLTKTPSFKPVRGATKRCARVALFEEMTAQKATCSSTMKESKFPAYLMLNPGGTEAEGTSVMRVCPYTYCSLNGHHHDPVPPLKHFLKAKRLSLKTKKSVKPEMVSTCRAKTSNVETEESDCGLVGFAECGTTRPENAVLVNSAPMLKEFGMNFFIEIYANNSEDPTAATDKSAEEDDAGIEDSAQNASAHAELNFADNLDQKSISEEMYIAESGFADKSELDSDAEYSIILSEEANAGSHDSRSEIEYDNISEAIDMVWEEGQFFALEIDAEVDYANKTDDDKFSENFKIKKADLCDVAEVIDSDDKFSSITEESLADECDLFGETASSVMKCNVSDCEMDGMPNREDTSLSVLTHDQFASSAHSFFVLAAMEGEEKGGDFSNSLVLSASMGEQTVETKEAGEETQQDELFETGKDIFQGSPQPGDVENDLPTDFSSCAFDALHPDDATVRFRNEISDERDEAETDADHVKSQQDSESYPNLAVGVSAIEQELLIIDATVNSKHVPDAESLFVLPDSSPSLSKSGLEDYLEHIDSKLNAFDEANRFKIPLSIASDDHIDSKLYAISLAGNNMEEEENIGEEASSKSETAETVIAADGRICPESESNHFRTRKNSKKEVSNACNNKKWTIGCRKLTKDELEEEREFNPREPNFLPVVLDPEAEKVDLRHQLIDDRKNAEEWMLDYALQRAVTKLDPARKKKVALLVEAFETVLPIPRYKAHVRHPSAAFSHARTVQACS